MPPWENSEEVKNIKIFLYKVEEGDNDVAVKYTIEIILSIYHIEGTKISQKKNINMNKKDKMDRKEKNATEKRDSTSFHCFMP